MLPVTLSQRLSLLESRTDISSVGVLLLFLWGWHWRVTGYLSLAAGASLLFFLILCLAYGSIFMRLIAPIFQGSPGIPFQILSGFFVFNSFLFVVALCSPFGMVINLTMLSIVALLGSVGLRKRDSLVGSNPGGHLAGFLVVLISCVGATIWCNDAQTSVVRDGNVIFQIFYDVYIHAREISVFAQAHGIASMQDIKLAGGRAPIYHFASYLSPAAISALSGASAMAVYASLQLPLGILLTGLAAYCFMGKLFGWGPGVAATVAIVLLPDAYQQGFQNRYLSYNFMAQVNLGMLYGIACIAMAWMFMLDGCRRGKYGTVALAYMCLGLCVFYKAHLFVANSYVLMMFPFVFFTRLRLSWRVVLGLLATVIFCLTVSWSQTIPRVPVLRFDGSGISAYLVLLLQHYDRSWIQRVFAQIFLQENHSLPIQALYACAMLLISTFGLWLAGLAVGLIKTWRKMPVLFWLFPIIVVGNYLLMAMGLALDNRNVGEPEELVNRPLVWAYFAVAAWTAAILYRLIIGEGSPQKKYLPVSLLTLMLCFLATAQIAPNLQTYPRYAFLATYAEQGSVPLCMDKAAQYLRLKSKSSDIILDIAADPHFTFTALSERQLYVGKEKFGGNSPTQRARLTEIAQLATFNEQIQVQQFFKVRGIDWFFERPDTQLAWPMASLPQPAFSCGGFKLFQFARAGSV